MSTLESAAQRLADALKAVEDLALPLTEARAAAARTAAEADQLRGERERLLARIAELEEENRLIASLTEEVETRLDGAISDVRSALGR